MVYSFFRAAAIAQGILGRVRDGTASSFRATVVGMAARRRAEAGWSLVEERGLRDARDDDGSPHPERSIVPRRR